MEANSSSMTTVPSGEQPGRDGSVFVVACISLCVGLINSLVIVLTILWLYRHHKLRRENDPSLPKKVKTGKPSKILSIDYKMTSLDMVTADEYCPQRYTSSTREHMATGQGGRADQQNPPEMDNVAFTSDPESVQFEPEYITTYPSRVT